MSDWADPCLADAIEAALDEECGMSGAFVEVEVNSGEVTLRGYVHSPAQRERATHIAANFGGVSRLRNDLQVTP